VKLRAVLTAATAGLFCAQALAAPPVAGPAAAPGPWAKVPALPTACYSSQDQWWDQSAAALDAVQQAHYRQNDVNEAIRQQATEAFSEDPMAVAARMQQAMLDDPQNAQKMMEQMMQQGEQTQTEVPAQMDKEKQMEAESRTLMNQYRASLANAMAPGNARWSALKKRYGLAADANHPGESGVPDWVWNEWHVIQREWDRGYEANCVQYFAANGAFHAYMKRYKDYLVLERIPYEKRFIDEPALQHYQSLQVSTTGWRTTTDYDAAEDYIEMARTLFSERATTRRCGPGPACQ
jgi:hypothetical protein